MEKNILFFTDNTITPVFEFRQIKTTNTTDYGVPFYEDTTISTSHYFRYVEELELFLKDANIDEFNVVLVHYRGVGHLTTQRLIMLCTDIEGFKSELPDMVENYIITDFEEENYYKPKPKSEEPKKPELKPKLKQEPEELTLDLIYY